MSADKTSVEPSLFAQYVYFGFKLCVLRGKRPVGGGWNQRANAIVDPARAQHLENAGLLLAYSGVCTLDVDNYDASRHWLKQYDIDLDALFAADDAVQISSGTANRGKLLYALPQPLATKRVTQDSLTLFELRCASGDGLSVQDVLPPSLHPSGRRYEWKFNGLNDWRDPPPLPEAMRKLWLSMLEPVAAPSRDVAPSATWPELQGLLNNQDPNADYETWIRVGMALHFETQGEAFALWDEWSAKSGKYPGSEQLQVHWDSFGRNTGPSITAGSLRRDARATDADFGPPVDQDLLAAVEAEAHVARVARFKWKPLDDYAHEPPPNWLIKKLLPEKPLNMLYGPSGAGKSAITLDMALAITRGIPWRGLNVKQGAVCWFAAEAEGSMRNRSLAYRLAHKLNSVPNFFVMGREATLTDREAVRALAESAKVHSPVLVVVDTLAAASGGANENSGEHMGPVLDNCVVIHEITGASVLLIHHSGKNELAGARGWSGIKARVDAEIEVKKGDNDMRTATPDKMRDGEEGQAFTFKLVQVELGRDEDGDRITSVVVEHIDDLSPLKQHNAARKGQGKWHRAIRAALLAAPDMRLEGEALIKSAILNVPEKERTTDPKKQVKATLNQMIELDELRVVDGCYEFAAPPVAGNPDRARVDQLLAEPAADDVDPDSDLLGD